MTTTNRWQVLRGSHALTTNSFFNTCKKHNVTTMVALVRKRKKMDEKYDIVFFRISYVLFFCVAIEINIQAFLVFDLASSF